MSKFGCKLLLIAFIMSLGSTLNVFSQAAPVLAVTDDATSVSQDSATLNGTVTVYGEVSSVFFEYGLDTEYGSTIDAEQSPVSAASATAVTAVLYELSPATEYHYRVVVTNTNGTFYGQDMTFTTTGLPPAVFTGAATGIGADSATLNALVNARGDSTTVTFEYGLDDTYGTTVAGIPSPLTNSVATAVTALITGLSTNNVYHYRVVATNSSGTSYGNDMTFHLGTVPGPASTTQSATSVTASTAQLNGLVDPNDLLTAVTFEYGLDDSYGSAALATQSPVSGDDSTAVNVVISELEPNTTYHYRVSSVNAAGADDGADMTFTTLPIPPSAQTQPATSVTSTGATLNGLVNANNTSTTVTFQYGLTDSYGSTVTASQSPLSGTSDTAVSAALTGLTNGFTYHYRVVASSAGGTVYGADITFTAGTPPPAVTTSAATSVDVNTATLNGTGNANGFSTSVTFEWGATTSYGRTALPTPSTLTGTSDTPFSVDLAGLDPGTLYHYRAVGQNAGGVAYGADMTFTTLAPPQAVTDYASEVSNTGATLNGVVDANDSSTTVTFQYGITTAYGTTVTADQSPVTGNGDTAVSRVITGLTPNTTYHYRVVGTNANGTTNGEDLTFYTISGVAPTATTEEAFPQTTGAVVTGLVNPNNASTTVTFEYGTTVAYGSTVTADQSPLSGYGDFEVSAQLTGLSFNTTYHYRVVATNANGTTNGADMTFITSLNPVAVTKAATGVAGTFVTLNGTVNSNGGGWNCRFDYGTTVAYGSTIESVPSLATGSENTDIMADLTGLIPNTLYHYRAVIYSGGMTYNGADMTFTTLSGPSVTTDAATSVGTTSAQLNGTVNANGESTAVTFEYGLDTNYGSTVNADQTPVTGNTNTAVTNTLTNLQPGTTYHYRAVAQNALGTVYGGDMTFTTSSAPPTAVTEAASGVSSTAATLNGTVNASNDSTTVTFEYGLTMAYGTTVSADQSPVTGVLNTAVSKGITGLTNNTTYHYRVVAQNSTGTSNGADMTFFTGGQPPVANTQNATSVTMSGATLNGTVNANDSSTTVTFEYGLTTAYGVTVTADQSPVTGTSDTPVSVDISGLAFNNTFHYRVVASNISGTVYGSDMTFTTVINPVISGTVTDGVNPIEGVSVTFSHNGHTELTGPDGTYSYQIPFNSGTTVTPSHLSYESFTPPSVTFTSVLTDQSGVDFVGTLKTYPITASSSSNGSVTPSGTVMVPIGSSQTFVFMPDTGYALVDVVVDGSSVGTPVSYTFRNVTQGHTIYGEFDVDQMPVIDFLTVNPETGNAPLDVMFETSAYDPDGGDIVAYQWDFDSDGTVDATGYTGLMDYTFYLPGEYTVTLTVVDNEGSTASESLMIKVAEASPRALYLGPGAESKDTLGLQLTNWVINSTSVDAQLELIGKDADGNTTETVMKTLNAGEKLLLDHAVMNEGTTESVLLHSNMPVLVCNEIEQGNARMAAWLDTPLTKTLYVPHIAEETTYWNTLSVLSNYYRRALECEVAGAVDTTEANYHIIHNTENALPGDASVSESWGTYAIQLPGPFGTPDLITGYELFVKEGNDGAAVELVSEPSDMFYVPHIPTETDLFWTGFAFVNPQGDLVTATVDFYDIDGQLCGSSQLELNPFEKIKGTMDTLFPDVSGTAEWAVIEADGKILALELYGTYDAGICGYGLPTAPEYTSVLPFVKAGENEWTGMSITNPSMSAANVTISVYDHTGQTLKGTVMVEIPSMMKFKDTLKLLFPGVDLENSDVITVESDVAVLPIEVAGNDDWTFLQAIAGRQ